MTEPQVSTALGCDRAIACEDCAGRERALGLLLITADLGEGAFLAVLCDVCWHRRCYRADLRERRREMRNPQTDLGDSIPGASQVA